ncbi:hypothetical protein WUBG_02155 [Wuchereria bancrofti]|uniref:Uncharacterized protein n=1 Tax=Wuchereria bancrofti TaxID=6293 RepID=J9EWE6_WUCBA|nr:hypothetical protein WUBG_02155 [Wuchereria bancrofti]
MMLLLRFSSKLSWRYQQLLLVLLLAVTICYAIPMKYKYDDPFVMDVNTFLHTKRESGFLSIEASMDDDDDDENSIRNITALVRSKRSCCGCCCCCCCWHLLLIQSLNIEILLNKCCCCCGKKRKRSIDGIEIGQGSLSRRRRALHDLERWNYMQNTKQNIRSALLELI